MKMEEIEFKMEHSKDDYTKALHERAKTNPLFRAYPYVMVTIIVVSVIYQNIAPSVRESLAVVAGLAILALIAPGFYFEGQSRCSFKAYRSLHDIRDFWINSEGIGYKSPLLEANFSWELVEQIRETPDFIFLWISRSPLTIYKHKVSQNELQTIHRILLAVKTAAHSVTIRK